MMLDSIDNGPLVYPTIEENGQTRIKKYSELTEAQQLQDDCDVQATNIILHSLSPDVYALVNHQEAAKDIWDKVKLLMKDTTLSYQEHECRLYNLFDKFASVQACVDTVWKLLVHQPDCVVRKRCVVFALAVVWSRILKQNRSGETLLLGLGELSIPKTCTRNELVCETGIVADSNFSADSSVRIIPGTAGIVQAAKLLKQMDILLGLDGAVMCTQEYMKKVVEDVGEDEDFKSRSWLAPLTMRMLMVAL
ncbi:hypothetical protein Tco_1335536 [Tanacetum coccineum]